MPTTAEVCVPVEQVQLLRHYPSRDPRAIGNGVLFEEAKYAAIDKVRGADGIISIHAKVDENTGRECVTVTGRAYRVLSLRATGGCKSGEKATPTPPVHKNSEDLVRPENL